MTNDTELTAGAAPRHIDAGRSLWLFSWPLIAALYAYVFILSRGQDVLLDGDTYSHIAIGRWILDHGVVPTQDVFSQTMRGTEWTAFEWLSQVALALAHQWGGWIGLVALTALALSLTVALMTRFLLRSLEPIYALLFVGAAISMTAAHVLARPHMLAMPLLMMWTIELVRAAEERRTPSLWMLPLMTLWANLHGGFTLGIAFVIAFGLEAVLLAWREGKLAATARGWAVFLVLTITFSLMTPHGHEAFLVTWQVMFQDSYALSHIGEWLPPNFHVMQPLELWLVGALALILHQGLRLPPVRLLLLLGLIHLSLKHMRYAELLGQLAPLFLATPLAQQWRQRRGDSQQLERADRLFGRLAQPAGQGALAIGAMLFMAVPLWVTQVRPLVPPATIAPVPAIRAAQQAGLHGTVLNAYEWGGYLMFLGTAPFIDGRSDLYRDAFIEQYLTAIGLRRDNGLEELLEKHKVAWTLLPPSLPAVALLDRLPGWRRVYQDEVSVIHARAPVQQQPTRQGSAP
jgi:hypothetical protein